MSQLQSSASNTAASFFSDDSDADEMIDDEYKEEKTPSYAYSSSMLDDQDDDMPYKYRHIRTGLRSVRKEYYVLAERLKAELHMSEKQVQGSIIATANMLFGRSDYGEWKLYNRDVPSDDNTLPAP